MGHLRGQRYLDLVQGWAVNTHGPCPARTGAGADAPSQQAAAGQARPGQARPGQAGPGRAGPGFYNDQASELAQRLTRLSGLGRAFICTSGAEPNEAAVKPAHEWRSQHKHGKSGSQSGAQHGGVSTLLSFEHSFQGHTLAMMAASGNPVGR